MTNSSPLSKFYLDQIKSQKISELGLNFGDLICSQWEELNSNHKFWKIAIYLFKGKGYREDESANIHYLIEDGQLQPVTSTANFIILQKIGDV